MASIFGKIQNVKRPLNPRHFAGCHADPGAGFKGASDDKEPLIAAVFDGALVDHENAGQRIFHHIDRGHASIRCERQGAGQKQTRFNRIKTRFTPFGKARGVSAEGISVIGRDTACELGKMNAKLKVFPRFDN